MRLLISVLVLLSVGLGAAGSRAATPAEIWPAKVPDAVDAKVPEAAAAGVAPELGPAVRFQGAFLRVLAGAPKEEWLPVMRTFAAGKENDPVSVGLREVARAWVARAAMDGISEALDQYYVINVRYPARLSEVEAKLPADAKTDPWGEAWAYQTRSPRGFPNQNGQRYQIGPKRYPDLGTLRAVRGSSKEVKPPAWKLVPKTMASNRALEVSEGGKVVGVITPGGRIEGYSLLYVGEGWALLAGTDQLFTVSF